MQNIFIEVDSNYQKLSLKICKAVFKEVIKIKNIKTYDVNIIFTSDVLVSDLKKKYFSKNQWTDVIAFPLHDKNASKIEGEIYISMPTAKENSYKFNEPYEKEILRLIIHGTLHLMGFSDSTKSGKETMSMHEEEYLKKFEWNNLFLNEK